MKPSFEESYVQLQQHWYIWGWLQTCSKTLAGLIPQEEPIKNSPSPHLLQPRKAHKHLNHTCPTKAVQPYAEMTKTKHHYAIFWYYFCEFTTAKRFQIDMLWRPKSSAYLENSCRGNSSKTYTYFSHLFQPAKAEMTDKGPKWGTHINY